VCIPRFEHQEIGGQSCEKISLLPSFLFFFSQPVFSYFLRYASATTNHTLVFPTPPGTPPAIIYLWPGKVSPPSPHVPPSPRGGRCMILHAMAKWLTWSLGRASDHVSLGRTCSGPTQCKRRERLGLLGHSWPNLTQLSHAYPNIFNNNIIIL
jgi:hypothetical protein